MSEVADARRLSVMVDYLFGRGVSRALPRGGIRLVRSRRSGRVKLVFIGEELFATVKPNGAMALSMLGAETLAKSRQFRQNCVMVSEDAAPFVRGGKSVFCKFVTWAGGNVLPRGEATVIDSRGKVLGVGTSVLNGKFIKQFKSGTAVKVRVGLER